MENTFLQDTLNSDFKENLKLLVLCNPAHDYYNYYYDYYYFDLFIYLFYSVSVWCTTIDIVL